MWSKYAAGDTQALVDAAAPDLTDTAGNAASENGNAVYTAVECTDAKWPRSWKKWDRDNTKLHKNHPFMTWANAWMNLPCATWQSKQYTPVTVKTKEGLPPVLIVQAERDAATPYTGAVELHKRFKGSRLITEKNSKLPRGHRPGQLLCQRACGHLPAHRRGGRGRCDVRPARHPGTVGPAVGP